MVLFIKSGLLRLFTKLLVLSIFLCPQISLGNDSSSCIGMGGLVFQKNDKIKMLSEDLKISPDLIKVNYVYHWGDFPRIVFLRNCNQNHERTHITPTRDNTFFANLLLLWE